MLRLDHVRPHVLLCSWHQHCRRFDEVSYSSVLNMVLNLISSTLWFISADRKGQDSIQESVHNDRDPWFLFRSVISLLCCLSCRKEQGMTVEGLVKSLRYWMLLILFPSQRVNCVSIMESLWNSFTYASSSFILLIMGQSQEIAPKFDYAVRSKILENTGLWHNGSYTAKLVIARTLLFGGRSSY